MVTLDNATTQKVIKEENKARRTKQSTDWAEYKCPRPGKPNYQNRTSKTHCLDAKFFK